MNFALLAFFALFWRRLVLGNELDFVPPVVDIDALINPEKYSEIDLHNARINIHNACRRWGFFQVINHG